MESSSYNLPKTLDIGQKWITAAGGAKALDKFYLPIKKNNGASEVQVNFTRQEKHVLRRKKPVQPSVWCEKNIRLPRDAAVTGPWRNSMVPYTAGIMDASFFPSVEEIIVCAAPQTAKTTIVYNCIGYAADRKPGNAMITFPSEEDSKDNSADRIQPMFDDSPLLRSYTTGYADDMAGKKIKLQHMIIYMAWASSPGRLANRPLPYVHLDEEDKYPATAGSKEASPADLAKKRSRTFSHMRKIWRTSSPSIETGPIWRALTEEAQVIFDFYVECPTCGAMQKMVFEQIKWTEGERDPVVIEATRDVWYQCKHCEAEWDDADRDRAVRAGKWIERVKEWQGRELFTALEALRPLRIGFHIPAWISPFVKLWECAAAFLKGLGNRNKLKDFLNGFAAEPWKIVDSERTEDRIMSLADDRPRGMVPGGGQVSCLLAGVDTQDNGFYYEIRAFGYGMKPTTWCVREGFTISFEALEQILWMDQYKDSDGNIYPVRLAVQDAMGHRTADVYRFCQQHRGLIMPSMGKDRLTQPYGFSNIEYLPGTKQPIPGGIQLVRLDTNYYKNNLASILEVPKDDPGCWYYNSELTIDWARQMTAEGIGENGLWINPHERPNHAWDCAVLLLLAADLLGVRFWKKAEEQEQKQEITKKSGNKNKQKSTMW